MDEDICFYVRKGKIWDRFAKGHENRMICGKARFNVNGQSVHHKQNEKNNEGNILKWNYKSFTSGNLGFQKPREMGSQPYIPIAFFLYAYIYCIYVVFEETVSHMNPQKPAKNTTKIINYIFFSSEYCKKRAEKRSWEVSWATFRGLFLILASYSFLRNNILLITSCNCLPIYAYYFRKFKNFKYNRKFNQIFSRNRRKIFLESFRCVYIESRTSSLL